MASRKRASSADYEQLQVKYEKLERKHLKLKHKYKGLALSSDEDSSDEEIEQHPAKKQCTNQKPSMDALLKLNPDCFEEVLKYLKPKELLDCKLVSKSWQNFIESRTTLMKRTMNRIVVNVTSNKVKKMKIKSLDKILQSERVYKHMKAEFKIHHKIFRFPLENRAATLETLELSCVPWELGEFEPEPLEFPVLKKLSIKCSRNCTHKPLMNFIEASTFPEVTHFKMRKFDTKRNLDTFIKKFPKLRVLSLSDCAARDCKACVVNPPNIEAISLDSYLRFFLWSFKDTLTDICLENISSGDLANLLNNFKNLTQITVQRIYRNSFQFPIHENLNTLKVGLSSPDEESFRSFLRALPSLHTLIIIDNYYRDITNEFIQFLAMNMKKLKTLSCRTPEHTVLEFYKNLRDAEDPEMNTSFTIQTTGRYGGRQEKFGECFSARHFN